MNWHSLCFIESYQEESFMTISNIASQSQVSKTLAAYPTANYKALSGAGSVDPTVGAWVEENQDLYNQIMNGSSGLSQTDQGQFMEWWNWAMSSMNGASSDWGQDDYGMEVVDGSGEGYDVGAAADPFGATPGANGNLVFTDSEVRVGFIGEDRPYDVWATDFTLDVSSTAAKVTVEDTTDTRFNPPEAVKRITVTDKATGKTSVYYLHDTDASTKITINTPNGNNVSGNIAGVTVGSYKKPTDVDPNAAPESNVTPEEIDGKLIVEAPIGQTVELTPAANGEDQIWEVYGSYNISARPSDHVLVKKTGDDTYTIEVKHRDGSKDTYLIQAGSEGNINATPANVTFTEALGTKNVHGVEVIDVQDLEVSDGSGTAAPAEPVEVKIPDGWDHLTLNGGAEGEESETVNGDQPTRVEDGVRIYDGQDFNVSPVGEGKDKSTMIDASGNVTITPNSNGEYFSVSVENGRFVVKVYSDAARTELKETISIDANLVDSLTLNVDASRLQVADMSETYEAKIKKEASVAGGDALPSGEEILANLPIYISASENMLELVTLFDVASKSGMPTDWKKFLDKLTGMDPRNGNDAIRSLITAIYKSVGKDDAKLSEMLDLIPAEIRTGMADVFARAEDGTWRTDDELDERHEGEIWNSEDTRSLLRDSIND